jgi:hypothetical protein
MLSTPLISKIKNKFRAMGEPMHKFREGFKALKTNVSEGPIRRPERGE